MTSDPPCPHERGHITDSRLSGNCYATEASRRIFCDTCRFQRWLGIEAALALTQADLGIVPAEAAAAIAAAAHLGPVDPAAVDREARLTGHTLVGLLRVLARAAGPESGQYVHFGATTQDIQDTAQSLELRDVLDQLQPQLDQLLLGLTELTERHAHTLALGRTHAQPALPISFGLKPASWIDELLRHRERLAQLRERALVVQLFGAAGTMAGFGGRGPALLEGFAKRLGLQAPVVGWHVARDRVAEFTTVLAMLCGTLARIADEIRTLSRPEFGEISEEWQSGLVCSSTMPHKRNPERSEQVAVLAQLAAAQLGPAWASMTGEHERDARSWRLEWAFVPDVSHYTLAALETTLAIVGDLRVHEERLLANLAAVADQVMSERLMLALGRKIGKQHAYQEMYELVHRAQDLGHPIRLALQERTDWFTPGELATLLDPAGYLGCSAQLAHRTAAHARTALGTAPDSHRPGT
ncbi:adenylosuccinate lyase family protein [Kitasatospora sp. NPDC002040]|uniref:class-II fumarase/aspartase family protein n=1 Tax=Kitasatospora sp. NPDC002040 TaxID=3154661 RepID=UPI00332400A3